MHICQDEIAAVTGFFGFVPFTARWVWYRISAMMRRRREADHLPQAVIHRR
jgi:hypothetical protein